MVSEGWLSREEIVRVLSSSKFRRNVASLAAYTTRTGNEGGLAVYKSVDVPSGSSRLSTAVDLPGDAVIEARRAAINEGAPISEYIPSGYEVGSFSSDRLLRRRHRRDKSFGFATPWGRPRRDVVLFIHSHPAAEFERPQDALSPSLADLDSMMNQLGFNPRLICGILVVDGVLAKILMIREPASREVLQLWHNLEDELPQRLMLSLLRKCGLKMATLRFDLGKGMFLTDPAWAARILDGDLGKGLQLPSR